jgi:hypothetical protein
MAADLGIAVRQGGPVSFCSRPNAVDDEERDINGGLPHQPGRKAVDRQIRPQTPARANKNSKTVNSFSSRIPLKLKELQNPYLFLAVNSLLRNWAGEKRKLAKSAPLQDQKVNRYWPKKAQSLGLSPKALCVRESILWK